MSNIVIEELTLTPLGTSKEIGFKPLRITIDGNPQPVMFNARDIVDTRSAIRQLRDAVQSGACESGDRENTAVIAKSLNRLMTQSSGRCA